MTLKRGYVVFIAVVLFFAVGVLSLFYSGVRLKLVTDNVQVEEFSGNDNLALTSSQIEWLDMLKRIHAGILKSLLISVTIQGEVVDISSDFGRIGGLSSYFTGTPGYYEYLGKLTLKNSKNEAEVFYLSKKRMELLKVYDVNDTSEKEIVFSDLNIGDFIELEETVDLSKDNKDDKNVLNITIRRISGQ